MLMGKVHFFDSKNGYGFITPETGKEDIFVHYTAIKISGYKALEVGQKVSFMVAQGKRGPQAVNVVPVS
ncbi:cold-shock protein [Liquorilactobacillus aquaticus]|nr:cold-shock protein [Liquorilactobacillus aquaticus]